MRTVCKCGFLFLFIKFKSVISVHKSLHKSFFVIPIIRLLTSTTFAASNTSVSMYKYASFVVRTSSYLNPMEFLAVAPIVPILLFIVALFGFVALAYYLGGKKILKCDLVEALRTDYMG